MELDVGSRFKKAWNAFMNKDPTVDYKDYGVSYSYRPDRPRLTRGNEKSIINSVCNRIALDVANLTFMHCTLDKNDRFESVKDGYLNECLTLEANIDQSSRAFIQDIVLSMLDEGVVAVVPVDTDIDPTDTSSYDILSMRTGQVIEWYPRHIKVRLYDDRSGQKKDIKLPKANVAIMENPFYSIMNEPNSNAQRLKRKLALLDVTDEKTASNKLDLIIKLPYTVKTEAKRKMVAARQKELEMQLTGPYGIGYIDATENVTQLNRPVENNLLKQIEYLTNLWLSQLGITQGILDGTADEQTMLNYMSRIIEPIAATIVDEMKRKFLSKTARTRKQTIMFFKDPFKLVPINNIAEIADKFTRNEIMTSNEMRQVVGMKPSNDPKADQLVNSNISQPIDRVNPAKEVNEES